MKTMKNLRIINICIALLTISFWSCEKDLDLTPEDEISSSSFFVSVNDFKTFATTFYASLPRPAGDDQNTDIAYREGGSDISRGTLIPAETSSFWNDSYTLIRRCNVLLQKAAEASPDLTADIRTYEGEAFFFRAMAYYRMYKIYGGLPLITRPLDTDSEELQAPRNSRSETINQIIADLDAAIALLPDSVSGDDWGRIDKMAATAYKARVALFEGTWNKNHSIGDSNSFLDMAIAAANQVISSNRYELFDRRDVLGEDSYRMYFNLDSDGRTNPVGLTKLDDKETILRVVYDREIRTSGFFAPLQDVRAMNPTKAIMDLFLCSDGLPLDQSAVFQGYDTTVDEYTNRDPRMSAMMYIPDTKYWNFRFAEWWRVWGDDSVNGFVYMGDGDDWGGRTATGYNGRKFLQEVEPPLGADYPFIRLAEVLLIYAEARFERDGSISDNDLNLSINKLRQRVGMPDLTNAFVTDNSLNIRNEIRRERTVELSFEGFRYDDIRRWKTAETILPQPIKGVKWAGTQWSTDPRYSSNVFPQDGEGFIIVEDASVRSFDPNKHYLLPLPQRELLLNPNLEQNPGWD